FVFWRTDKEQIVELALACNSLSSFPHIRVFVLRLDRCSRLLVEHPKRIGCGKLIASRCVASASLNHLECPQALLFADERVEHLVRSGEATTRFRREHGRQDFRFRRSSPSLCPGHERVVEERRGHPNGWRRLRER